MSKIVPRTPFMSDLTRFDPFINMEDWFRGFPLRPYFNEPEIAPSIKIDLKENDKSYTVRAEIPGVNKEDIKVEVEGSRVTISTETKKEKEEKEGERVICRECYEGASYRSFTLNSAIDEAKTEAKYKDGILELTLPKADGSAAKKITVK